MSKPLEIGDQVTFTEVRARGQGLNFTTRTGTIERFSIPNGLRAKVRLKGKRFCWKSRTELRRVGETTALTEAVMGKAAEPAAEEHQYGSGEHDVVLDAIREHIEGT